MWLGWIIIKLKNMFVSLFCNYVSRSVSFKNISGVPFLGYLLGDHQVHMYCVPDLLCETPISRVKKEVCASDK